MFAKNLFIWNWDEKYDRSLHKQKKTSSVFSAVRKAKRSTTKAAVETFYFLSICTISICQWYWSNFGGNLIEIFMTAIATAIFANTWLEVDQYVKIMVTYPTFISDSGAIRHLTPRSGEQWPVTGSGSAILMNGGSSRNAILRWNFSGTPSGGLWL